MPQLSDAVKTFIVQALAMHDAPSEVAEAVKEEFGVEITRQQVQAYDPERAGEKPARRWVELHAKTREAFVAELVKEALAHRAVRVRELAKLYRKAKKSGNLVLASALLEQIAKEVGDAFSNRRVVSAEDPAEALGREIGIPAEDLRRLAAQAIAQGAGDAERGNA